MNVIRHVIFDLDGTLIDSAPGIAWSVTEALRACKLPPVHRDIGPLIGPPIREILSVVSGVTEPEQLNSLEACFRLSYDSEGWRRTCCHPGVQGMLWNLLGDGAELWLVTNKPAAVTARILSALKLAAFFRASISRDSVPAPFHSKAEMLADLLERIQMAREQCLLVGDTAEDWLAAEASGIPCVIVSHGYGAADLPACVPRIDGWEQLHPAISRGLEVSA